MNRFILYISNIQRVLSPGTWKPVIAGLLALLFSITGMSSAVLAQDDGSISGVITDDESGETLPGVNVIIKGTSLGAATNMEGEYTIENIRPGEYSIQVSYVGYQRTLLTGIEVEAGESTELDVAITPKTLSAEGEVVVIGKEPIFDVEKSETSTTISQDQIEAAPISSIQELVGMQAGVVKDPSGIYIRGGRTYETGYVVDGVSAQDPLAGTGFGLDLGSNAYSNVEVTTGGVGAEHGDVTSGVISVQTRSGGDNYSGMFSHKRDNFGSYTDRASNFYKDVYEFNLGGPSVLFEQLLPGIGLDMPGDFSFYMTGQLSLSNNFYGHTADQVETSLYDTNFFSPRQDNRWNGMAKLTYNIKPGMKLQGAYQRSLTVNQNTQMLQITGADVQLSPGYQFFYQQDLDNANTYAHDSNLGYLKWTHSTSETMFYEIQVSRLFTRLRADANGRNWRPDSVDGEFDAESITTYPVDIFEQGSQDFRYVLPGPGLANNGGIASLWHDHFAEEIVVQSSVTKFLNNQDNELTAGLELKFQDYQWIDIQRPWVGAPIQIGEGEFSETQRLGESYDIWHVKPKRGAFYVTDKIRYKGLVATLGARFQYWAPGKFVDKMVNDPDAPILDEVRQEYKDGTTKLLGQRFKFRLLPKIRVSFPVRENQVLFFNYGHSTRLPHPRYIYAGLNPFYQDRSFLSDLGNPDLDPAVDISYEIGLRNQLSENDALNISAFWRDKYDFVTTEQLIIEDATGRETEKAFRVNGDYARVRGIEATYIKRYSDWLMGQVSATYSRAEGLSSTNDEALRNLIVGGQNVGNNVESPLAWDRPWDVKGNVTLTYDRDNPLLGVDGLNKMEMFISGVWRSGRRYTPYNYLGRQTNPVTGERDWRPIYERESDPTARYSKVGASWFYIDLNLKKWFQFGDTRVTMFMEITNLLNNDNPAIVNPVTGKGYKDYPNNQQDLVELRDNRSYDMPNNQRDPRFLDPRSNTVPAYRNPSNYLQQRHIMFGATIKF